MGTSDLSLVLYFDNCHGFLETFRQIAILKDVLMMFLLDLNERWLTIKNTPDSFWITNCFFITILFIRRGTANFISSFISFLTRFFPPAEKKTNTGINIPVVRFIIDYMFAKILNYKCFFNYSKQKITVIIC